MLILRFLRISRLWLLLNDDLQLFFFHLSISFFKSVERELGQGTFGKVYLCKNVESGLNCAIKVVRNIPRYTLIPNLEQQHSNYRYTAAAKIEISILKNLTRKNHAGYYPIVQLFHDFSFNGHVCLVFPVHGISTYDYMKSIGYKPYKFNTIKSFCSQELNNEKL